MERPPSRSIKRSGRLLDVSRSGRFRWFLLTLRLGLIALGVLAWRGSAEASGCHGPDRPALGLSSSSVWERNAPLVPSSSVLSLPAQFRPSPCPVESPGITPRLTLPEAFVASSILIDPPSTAGRSPDETP